MSVGGVDKNRSNDVETRNRSDYAQKEAELNRKHAAEVNRIRQENYETMQELQEGHQTQMDQQRNASRETITERDLKYQKDIEDLREMNRQKMIGLVTAYEDKVARNREASQSSLQAERRGNEQQKKVLSETFVNEIGQKDKMYQEALENTKKMQKEGMSKEREDLSAKFKGEVELLVKDRNDRMDKMNDEMRGLRRAKDSLEKDSKQELFKTKNSMQDLYGYELMRERKTQAQQQELQRQASSSAIDVQKKRYSEALKAERERNAENLENVGQRMNDRESGQISVLERRLSESKDRSMAQVLETKRLADLEKKHIMEAVGDNLDSAERTRQLSLEDSNRKNAGEIAKINKQGESNLRMLDQENKERVNLMKVQHEEEVMQKSGALVGENEKLKTDSTIRDRTRKETFDRERKVLEDYYSTNLQEMKKNFDDTLSEQRLKAVTERNQMLARVEGQMRQNEAKANERHSLTVAGYEKKLADLGTQHKKSEELIRRGYDARLKTESTMAQQNLDNQKLKYETQIASMKEAYEEKIQQMKKNHAEEKVNMAKSTT